MGVGSVVAKMGAAGIILKAVISPIALEEESFQVTHDENLQEV